MHVLLHRIVRLLDSRQPIESRASQKAARSWAMGKHERTERHRKPLTSLLPYPVTVVEPWAVVDVITLSGRALSEMDGSRHRTASSYLCLVKCVAQASRAHTRRICLLEERA